MLSFLFYFMCVCIGLFTLAVVIAFIRGLIEGWNDAAKNDAAKKTIGKFDA